MTVILELVAVDSGCGQGETFLDPTGDGTVQSPGYPNSYAANLRCSWALLGVDDYTIFIGNLTHLDLEPTDLLYVSSIYFHFEIRNYISSPKRLIN